MTLQALAKVNLTLRIQGLREDGFHAIESLIVPISLADDVEIEVTSGNGVSLQCNDPTIPSDHTNLAARAAMDFATFTGQTFHTDIRLHKRIPHGAGLGGGSSDAAAVLRGLDAILGTKLTDAALVSLAAGLGSDVAFFLKSQPALCHGRGEVLSPSAVRPAWDLLLVKPPFPVSTAWAYRAFSSRVHPPLAPVTYDGVGLVNDLEAPVFTKYLQLPALKSWLIEQPGVATAMMSGSGSTLFAILADDAPDLERQITQRFGDSVWMHRVRTLG